MVPVEFIERKIYLIRGMKVMLDSDLAFLYQVSTKALNQAVKRNVKRFPKDFMFQLTSKEANEVLRPRSQFVTLKKGQNIKYLPYAFTEQGVAMLSSVLKSERAIQMNIAIVRSFIKLRELLATHKDLILEIGKIKQEQRNQNQKILSIISIINRMINPPVEENKEPMGFRDRIREKKIKK